MNIDRESISTLSARASSETVQFDPLERSAKLRLNIQQIRAVIHRGTPVSEIKEMYKEFAEEYSAVFEMITRPGGYDERSMQIMINMLEHMGAGKLSQHEASVHVGKYVFDKYANPQIPSNTNAS